ncbi:hypothetical protein J0H58_27070 [bacterium]|nr:hypothetical protein [bacterium]
MFLSVDHYQVAAMLPPAPGLTLGPPVKRWTGRRAVTGGTAAAEALSPA